MTTGKELLEMAKATPSDARLTAFATPTWVDSVASVPIDEVAVMVAEDPSVLTALVGALRHERAELARIRPVFDLACKLQDSDQCEDHVTGDDCEQGGIEHQLFEALVVARPDDSKRTDAIERGHKKRGPAVASTKEHVVNETDECVSWCPACLENVNCGLNPDGTARDG
jgi:hypothetical protein